ncbi:protein translocase subunit SecD [Saccharophagus sp. K07]|jgi:preprotein translocase subunit SecD|uniref:protein translocase subunit SecD n=1 Tax=Saccharophagus sp. K07 TaxID=2283636 RepID=UPI001651F933|nr:protein translocase subunit SecD [Saccharophagus sp. K07]MBC6905709.1 protein translocase subunit SecD [Saccharophagus sp. K07]
MNRFPLWKYVLLIVVISVGFIYALPNLYSPDPAIQVTANSRAANVDDALLKTLGAALSEAGIEHFGEEITEAGSAMIRLRDGSQQLAAQKVVQSTLNSAEFQAADKRYVVALNRASNTPDWLLSIGANPMNLGLDLAGGVHFLLEVDTPRAVADRMTDMQETIRKGIRERRLFNVDVKQEERTFVITAPSEETQRELMKFLQDNLPDLVRQRGSDSKGYWIRAQISDQTIREIEDHAVSQNLTTLRNRVNELGVSEPLVQRQGRNRIVVELPGVQDAAGAKRILGKTANLEFRLEALPETPVTQKEKFEFYTEQDRQMRGPKYLERRRIITGERVINAMAGFDDQSNSPKIDITLDSEGGNLMHHATRNEVGRNMGVLFIDYYTEKQRVVENGEVVEKDVTKEDRKIINLATIRSALGARFQITGLDSSREANDVALLLRAGSLAAPMVFVEERTVGPSLGAENIAMGIKSVQIGLLLLVIFMLVYYKVFGIVANIVLTMNLVLLTALMSILGATLTMPGIAGIVLTLGMAVDANVLIYSRIKEELKAGLSPQGAIRAGFDRAFTSIIDANLTTLIVAFILYAISSGSVKGFAVTLSLGIVTSVFTAVVGTRAIVNLIYGNRNVTKLWI